MWFRGARADTDGEALALASKPMETPVPIASLPRTNSKGFTIIELMIVLVVLGIMFVMGVPAFRAFSQSDSLKGAASGMAGQIQMVRARAMASGVHQPIHFSLDSTGAGDYHLHAGSVGLKWDLPRGIRYGAGSSTGFTMLSDGRASTSSFIILQNERGERDTVSVQVSGLVLVR